MKDVVHMRHHIERSRFGAVAKAKEIDPPTIAHDAESCEVMGFRLWMQCPMPS
jgi:hypothetical protein